MNIIAIVAHPDDIEYSCAGTLVLYAQAGHQVTFASFTDGSMGDLHAAPADLRATRRGEAQEAADIIGARLVWGGIVDEHVFPDAAQRHIMIDLIREADPDVILTHAPNDYHPDHRYVSQLVFDAYFQAGLPHIPDQQKPACRFAKAQLYYMDNCYGIDFQPTEYVDITSTMDLKRRMLACHRSQQAAMNEMVGDGLVETMEVVARFRGLAAGCRYAEAFTRCGHYPRGLARRVLP
jgi:N-acetylglucosamine malate deacetylase 1